MIRRILCFLGLHRPILVESRQGGANGEMTWYNYHCARNKCKWYYYN